MKKQLIMCAALAMSIFCVGCTPQGNSKVVDLEALKTEVKTLKGDEWSFSMVPESVENTNEEAIFGELTEADIYAEGLLENSGVDSSNLIFGMIKESTDEKNPEGYMILSPIEGKEETVKKDLETYYTALKEELKDNKEATDLIDNRYVGTLNKVNNGQDTEYIVSIVSKDNEGVLDRIENANNFIFGNLMDIEEGMIKDKYGIDPAQLEEYVLNEGLMVSASQFLIVKPAKGEEKAVKEALDTYMEGVEKNWSTYLPEEYDKAKNRTFEKVGDYLVYIISSDNEKVLETIKSNLK